MPGPRPDDMYNPTASVAPTLSAPSDYLTVRATPNAFGAQVGQALQGLGKGVTALGAATGEVEQKWFGIQNEIASTQAETQYNAGVGNIVGEYKNLPALEAVSKRQEYSQKLIKLRQDIRGTLNNSAAQRAFDMLTQRSEGYVLRDFGTYSADKAKEALRVSNQASRQLSIDQSSDPRIAFNDDQFKEQAANIKFSIAKEIADTFGGPEETGMKVDPKTGVATFDDSEHGQMAKVMYDNLYNKDYGQAWDNRIKTVAYDSDRGSIPAAEKLLHDHVDEIPPSVYAKLSRQLAAGMKNEETRNWADTWMSQVHKDYENSVGNPTKSVFYKGSQLDENQASLQVDKLFPGAIITSTARTPEKNASLPGAAKNSQHIETPGHPATAIDFVPSGGMEGWTKERVEEILDKQGLPHSEIIVLNHRTKDGEGPHIHWAWGDKSSTMLGQSSDNGTNYQSLENYLLAHRSDIIEQGVQSAMSANPNWGAVEEDTVRSRITTQVDQQISQEQGKMRLDRSALVNYALDHNLTDLSQLEHSPPEIQQAYRHVLTDDRYFLLDFQQSLDKANARGGSTNMGTEYYDLLGKILQGKITDIKQLPSVGYDKTSVLTNTGLRSLIQWMQPTSDPSEMANRQATLEFLNKARTLVTGSNVAPGVRTVDLDEKFNKYVAAVMPKIMNGLKSGKTPDDLFDEKSSDFVGYPPPTPIHEITDHITAASLLHQKFPEKPKPGVYNSRIDLEAARRNNQITDDQFRAIARQHPEWFSPAKQTETKKVDIFSGQ